MPKRDQLRRLLEIDKRIRNGEYPHPDHLAVELEVTRRVIFNDRAYLLNTLNAPIAFSRERGGWYYTEKNWALPSVLMTRGQLLAFFLAVEAAQHQLGPALESELQDAVEKIAKSLGESVEVDLESLRRHFSFASFPSARAEPQNLLALREAIERREVVHISYFSAHRGKLSERFVHPHHLYNCHGDWYLFAFDPARKCMLTFNVARIQTLATQTHTFTRRSDFSPQEFLRDGFRAESGPQIFDIKIRFDAHQATYIRERTWHATQRIEELPDGGLHLHFRSSGLPEVARWVLGYGGHAEVLAPRMLREMVREQAKAAVGVYGK